jgi:hypothetical protein
LRTKRRTKKKNARGRDGGEKRERKETDKKGSPKRAINNTGVRVKETKGDKRGSGKKSATGLSQRAEPKGRRKRKARGREAEDRCQTRADSVGHANQGRSPEGAGRFRQGDMFFFANKKEQKRRTLVGATEEREKRNRERDRRKGR